MFKKARSEESDSAEAWITVLKLKMLNSCSSQLIVLLIGQFS